MAQSTSITQQRPVGNQLGPRPTTQRLLTCGVLGAASFVIVPLVQVLTVPGFQISRHANSALETGPLGGIQMANFLISGLLLFGFAAGLRRLPRAQRGGVWGHCC